MTSLPGMVILDGIAERCDQRRQEQQHQRYRGGQAEDDCDGERALKTRAAAEAKRQRDKPCLLSGG